MKSPITCKGLTQKSLPAGLSYEHSNQIYCSFKLLETSFHENSQNSSLFFIESQGTQNLPLFVYQTENRKPRFKPKTAKTARLCLFCCAFDASIWTWPWPHIKTVENLHAKQKTKASQTLREFWGFPQV